MKRNTDIRNRQVRRATTTNYDIIKQAMVYWDVAEYMEQALEGIQLHNTQRRINVNIIYKLKELAKSLGHHLDVPNPNAFKTKDLTDKLYEQALDAKRQRDSRQSAQTTRSTQRVWFS